jgi:argininosuccinate lyase
MMPHKKNPDGAELIRGKTGRVVGDLVSLLTVVKGLPLSYNRDLQEDKEPLFDAAETLGLTLPLAAALVEGALFNLPKMEEAAHDSFMAATDIAEHLVLCGVPFRKAHHQVGALVSYALTQGIPLSAITPEELLRFCPKADPVILSRLDTRSLLEARKTFGGTSPQSVSQRLSEALELVRGEELNGFL